MSENKGFKKLPCAPDDWIPTGPVMIEGKFYVQSGQTLPEVSMTPGVPIYCAGTSTKLYVPVLSLIQRSMNQLPKVLQREIWEYVRGDRAHWKQKFNDVVKEVEGRHWREYHGHRVDSWWHRDWRVQKWQGECDRKWTITLGVRGDICLVFPDVTTEREALIRFHRAQLAVFDNK